MKYVAQQNLQGGLKECPPCSAPKDTASTQDFTSSLRLSPPWDSFSDPQILASGLKGCSQNQGQITQVVTSDTFWKLVEVTKLSKNIKEGLRASSQGTCAGLSVLFFLMAGTPPRGFVPSQQL